MRVKFVNKMKFPIIIFAYCEQSRLYSYNNYILSLMNFDVFYYDIVAIILYITAPDILSTGIRSFSAVESPRPT